MSQVSTPLPIQDPRVFVYCLKRPHFARRVLEDIFRQRVSGLTPSSVGIFEYERVDGTMGYSAHIGGIKLGADDELVTVILQRDFTDFAHLTARQVDCNLHPDSTTETVYVVTFVDMLSTVPDIGPLLKFTMRDLVSHSLGDKRWEYFVCCKFADKFTQPFLRSLCKLLRGEDWTSDEALLIMDTSWGAAADIHREDEERGRRFEEQQAEYDEGAVLVDDGENVAPEPKPEEALTSEGEQDKSEPTPEQEESGQAGTSDSEQNGQPVMGGVEPAGEEEDT